MEGSAESRIGTRTGDYRCPLCLSVLERNDVFFHCLECKHVFRVKNGVLHFSNARVFTSNGILSSDEIDCLHREIETRGWAAGISEFLGGTFKENVSEVWSLISESQAAWKLFLNFSELENALIFDTTLGTVTETFVPYCKTIYTLNPDGRLLECIRERLKEKGINNVRLIQVSKTKYLPFRDELFDLVILHSIDNILPVMSADRSGRKESFKWLIGEIKRALHPAGSLFFCSMNKWGFDNILRQLRNRHESTLFRKGRDTFSFMQIKRLLRKADFKNVKSYSVYPSILNMKEFRDVIPIKQCTFNIKQFHSVKKSLKDRLSQCGIFSPAFISIASNEKINSFVDNLLRDAVYRGEKYRTQKYTVGHFTMVISTSWNKKAQSCGFVIRIPLTEKGNTYSKQNMETLRILKSLNCHISSKIPTPAASNGLYRGQSFFVEEKIGGLAIYETVRLLEKAFSGAVDFLIDLHQMTATKQVVTDDFLKALLSGCRKSFGGSLHKAGIDDFVLIETYLRKKLCGKEIPMVFQHGDFQLENIMIDPITASINGIIDWEHSEKEGVPLLDCFHLVVSRRGILEGKNFNDIITEVVIPLHFNEFEEKVLIRYIKALNIERELLGPFAILYWIHHVEKRVRFGLVKASAAWIDKNILTPCRLVHSLYIGTQ